jgi:hypothetical protein
MVEKSISSYGDLESQSPFNSDKLIVNVGNTYMALLVKLFGREDAVAFELFEFEKVSDNWYDTFYSIKNQSKILDRSYNNTELYFNVTETVLIPSDKYSAVAGESFLTAVFGDSINQHTQTDYLNLQPAIVNVYRIQRSLFEIIRTNFIMVTAKHYYSKVIENIFGNNSVPFGTYIKLEFYKNQMLLILINYSKLQIIQTYNTSSPDDMLYYILSVLEQFKLSPDYVQLQISGFLDTRTQDYDYLKKIFKQISFDTIDEKLVNNELQEAYPAHYLSPFFKLLV